MSAAIGCDPRKICLCVAGVVALVFGSVAVADTPLEPVYTEPAALPEAPTPSDKVSVLVHFEPAANRAAVRNFAAEKGGVVKYEYAILPNVINLRDIPAAQVAALKNLPGVVRVEPDTYGIRINLHDSTPLIRGLQSQISGAGLSADGAGVRVCVCDTGIDIDHLMYADRIDSSAGWDFYNNDSNPNDDNGHGSHVSGIAVGGTGLSWDPCGTGAMPFQGVAPGATLIGAKILNQFGGGYDSDIIAGIDHCADQSASGGRADVINLSIGTGQYSGPCSHSWAVAANNAVANGVVVVAASGNENYSNAMGSPACGVDVIAVGMTWKADYPTCEDGTTNWNWGSCTDFGPVTDEVGCFSNESDYLDVAAPGANIWSASNAAGGSSITGMSGTSMASPQVAGLAALVLGADPSLTPAEVRQLIRDGAKDLGPAGFDRGYGYGRIDVINTLSLINPEICGNATCGGSEDECNCPQDCGTPPSTETSCTDGVDNDCDTFTDCDDGDCTGDPACICNDDGICETGEDCNNCSNDCFSGSGAVCGNGVCEAADGEDCSWCADCNGRLGGRPSQRYCCGDGSGQYGVTCGDGRCTGQGNTCTTDPALPSCCGDATCEGSEDGFNCEIDCGAPETCGNGNCGAGEDECNCAADCGTPPGSETNCSDGLDEDCDGGADCNDPTGECDNDPACTCGAKGDPCANGSDCCSGACKRNGTCR